MSSYRRGRRQESVPATFEHADARLWREVMGAPAHAIELQGAARTVIGHAALHVNATACAETPGGVRAQLGDPAVRGTRPDGSRTYPSGPKVPTIASASPTSSAAR